MGSSSKTSRKRKVTDDVDEKDNNKIDNDDYDNVKEQPKEIEENDNDASDDDDDDDELLTAAAQWAQHTTGDKEAPTSSWSKSKFEISKKKNKETTIALVKSNNNKNSSNKKWSLHITQLSYDATDYDIRTLFVEHGCMVTSVRLVYDTHGGANEDSYNKALALHKTRLLKRRINVRPTRTKTELANIVERTKELVAEKIRQSTEKVQPKQKDGGDDNTKDESQTKESKDDKKKKKKKDKKKKEGGKDNNSEKKNASSDSVEKVGKDKTEKNKIKADMSSTDKSLSRDKKNQKNTGKKIQETTNVKSMSPPSQNKEKKQQKLSKKERNRRAAIIMSKRRRTN